MYSKYQLKLEKYKEKRKTLLIELRSELHKYPRTLNQTKKNEIINDIFKLSILTRDTLYYALLKYRNNNDDYSYNYFINIITDIILKAKMKKIENKYGMVLIINSL